MSTVMEKESQTPQANDEDELLGPHRASEFLSELWGKPVSVTALRMIRLRRKDDPGMPEPDFEEGDIILWKRRTLRKIKPTKTYHKTIDKE